MAAGRDAGVSPGPFDTGQGSAVVPIGILDVKVLVDAERALSAVPQVMVAVHQQAERVIRYVALQVTRRLIEATPVDTGFARASWIPSVGQPSGATGGSPGAVSVQAREQGTAEVLAYKLAQGGVFVSNNARYIQRLNAGHSKQAPANFIEIAVALAYQDARTAFGGTR